MVARRSLCVLGLFALVQFQTFAQSSCDYTLEAPNFNDLMQYDHSLTDTLGLDGIGRPLINNTGLCGPVCVVNSIVTKLNLPHDRKTLLKDVVNNGISDLNIPHPRILTMTATWEVGRILKHQLNKLYIEAKIDYLGEPIASNNPDDYDTPLPSYAEVRPRNNIDVKDLRTANSDRTIMIALIRINKEAISAKITRLTGLGHFVIIEKVVSDTKTNHSYALIRDPETHKAYWTKLKYFKNDNFKFTTLELLPLPQTSETDKVIVPIVAIIRAKF